MKSKVGSPGALGDCVSGSKNKSEMIRQFFCSILRKKTQMPWVFLFPTAGIIHFTT